VAGSYRGISSSQLSAAVARFLTERVRPRGSDSTAPAPAAPRPSPPVPARPRLSPPVPARPRRSPIAPVAAAAPFGPVPGVCGPGAGGGGDGDGSGGDGDPWRGGFRRAPSNHLLLFKIRMM